MGESARSGKTIGIDLGAKRIGVALSDSNGTMAFPLATVERSGDDSADRSRLIDLVEESGSRTVVVGLPLTLRGTQGPAADLVRPTSNPQASRSTCSTSA
jgi:putative Holliday junction resolvase